MAETTPSLKAQLKTAEAQVAKIESKTAPLFEAMRAEWGKAEKAKLAYQAMKTKAMAEIAKLEGRDGQGGGTYFDLVEHRNRLLEQVAAEARRTNSE